MMNGYARGHAAPLFAVFLAATFCLSTFDITEHDYWWHLATGRYIIEGGWVPHRDVFSYTATRPWVAHYWLADVIGYTLYRFIGTPGLILLNAALITLSFSLVLRVALSAATPFIAVAASVVAVYASRSRFYVRPETVSFLFSGVYLWLLYRWKRTGAVWPLFIFPILQPLWTNLYGGGSVLGLLLLSCFCAGECMNTLFRREASCMTPLWTGGLIASSLAAFALAFINPNTYRAVFYFMMSRDPIFRHIIEWRYFAREDLLSLHGVLLVLGAALLLRFWRDTDWTELMLFSVFGYLSIDAPRSLPFFAMATVPLVASRLTRILDDADGRPRVPVWLYPAGAFALCMLTIWYLAKDAGKFQSDYSFGLGVNMKLVPVRAVDFVEENGVRGPIFNSYGIGGYLIWRLYPRERVFLDGRVEMYGTEFLKGYMLYWQPEVWEEYVRRYGITVAIIDREPNYTTRYLDESDRWALVFFDDRAMIYLRRVPQNEALIRRYAYRYMRPGSMKFDYLDASLVDPAKTFALIGELQRSIGDEQYSLNSHLMLGYCYLKLGPVYYQRALKEYQAAAAIMPESRDVREKIAWLQQQLKV